MNANALDFCTGCGKPNASPCTGCKNAGYCSGACQQADWPTHRLLCPAFSDFDASSRPSDKHIRVILFPVDEKRPRFSWLRCELHDLGDGAVQQVPDFESILGPDAPHSSAPVEYNNVLKKQLSDTIFVWFRDTFLSDGSKPNNSVATITATKPGRYHDWRGPIVAYGKKGLGLNQKSCKDLDMNDFRHITDFFFSYRYRPLPALRPPVKGVKINCLGDRKMLNKPHFEVVEVPSGDPIFSDHDTSDIAKRIGLPIYTRRCPPDPSWANDLGNKIFDGESPFNNQDATFLHLCLDPKAKSNPRTGSLGWGWASTQWQHDVGTTIVVRQDKKPLSMLNVEALCRYCRHEVSPLLSHSLGEYPPEEPMSKDAVLAMICRSTFIICYYKVLQEKEGENRRAAIDGAFDF